MKTIDTLVEDIQTVLKEGIKDENIPEGTFEVSGSRLSDLLRSRLSASEREDKRGLRMSNIGKPCNRQLWYSVNGYEKEELSASARLKFLYGDILEEVLLLLAELSGHKVEGRQDVQSIAGIEGHRDAVIDGVVVDTKSASTYSFKKFEEHRLHEDDPFGYVEQIQGYIHSGQDDPVVTDKDRGAFLVIDKTLGNLCLDIHKRRDNPPIEKVYEFKKDMVSREEPPARKYSPEPEGKSGNMKLPMPCSYCDFKKSCHPGLRTFLYANKPVFLTKVQKEPKVPEVKDGQERSPSVSGD